jgi:hypothetical protein
LTHQISSLLPPNGDQRFALSTVRDLSAEAKAAILPKLGRAFGLTFLWSFWGVLLAMAAALFPPRKKIEPIPDANLASSFPD